MSEKKIIGLPSGAGDTSWAWSKLYAVRNEIKLIEVADGHPRRTVPYVELWTPRDEMSEERIPAVYGQFEYRTILTFEEMNGLSYMQGDDVTWEKVKLLGYERILLQPNHHLEDARPLADWMPDLPTHYHYPLYTTEAEAKKAEWILRNVPKDQPTIGISCASYKGAEAWRTWKAPEWVDMIRRIRATGWHPILLGGWWDELTNDVFYDLTENHGMKENEDISCIVGKSSMGEAVEILKRLDSYLGYSSGLNVIRTVLNRPAMAFWPDFEGFSQQKLMCSWAPPHMQEWETGRYVARLWRPVDDVWNAVLRFLRVCDAERGSAPTPPCP